MSERLAAIRICGRAFSDIVAHLSGLGLRAQSSCSTERDPHAWLEFSCTSATDGSAGRPAVVSLYVQLARDPGLLTVDIEQPGSRLSQLFPPGQISRARIVERVCGLHQKWAASATSAAQQQPWDVPFADAAA